MGAPVLAEVIGLPVYWIDTAIPEDAGNGVVRVTNCVTRHGVLIPMFEVMIHSTKLIAATRLITDCAMEIFNSELRVIGPRH